MLYVTSTQPPRDLPISYCSKTIAITCSIIQTNNKRNPTSAEIKIKGKLRAKAGKKYRYFKKRSCVEYWKQAAADIQKTPVLIPAGF